MADWTNISALATAGGTLVLAVATFSSVRSANRSARVAELSLMAGMRPVLIPSREDDPVERVRFGDGKLLMVPGHGAAAEIADGNIYFAIGLRNGGTGLAVIHGWQVRPAAPEMLAGAPMPDPASFHRQLRDLYIPAADSGFWQGALRDPEDQTREDVIAAVQAENRVLVDLLYGDHEGGQRTIARFGITPADSGDGHSADVLRYWNVDREDPR
jgi:hypothetical protein